MNAWQGLMVSVLMSIPAGPAAATEWRASAPAVPALTLQDQDGKHWQIDDLLGSRPVLIGFIFTGCTTICPDTMLTMHGVQQKLAQSRLPASQRPLLLTIALDPYSDTPASLKKFARDQGVETGADADWLMLTANGLDEDIRPLLEAFGQPAGSPDAHDNLLWIGQPSRHRWAFATAYDSFESILQTLLDERDG